MDYPWVQHYDQGVPRTIGEPDRSLPWLLVDAAAKSPDSPALIFFGKTITYRGFREQVQRLSRSLRDLGLRKGDRVATLLPNCPQLAVAYHAVLNLGAVAVLMNPLMSPKEITFQLKDSGSRFLVVLDHLMPKVDQALAQVPVDRVLITGLADALPWPLSWIYPLKARWEGLPTGFTPGPGRHRFRDLAKAAPLEEDPVPGVADTALLQYTGGTTGVPKAAILTHGSLMANVMQINAWVPTLRYAQERLIGLIPFFHVFGLTVCLNWPLSQAVSIMILPKFDIKVFLKALRNFRPTILPGVPTLFVALINHAELPSIDFSELWLCISGSAALPHEVRDRFESLTNCTILEGYGLTEASPVTHISPVHGLRPPGSIGIPFPSTVAKIMDAETGEQEMPVGEMGELVIKGPQVMQEYWQRPEETAVTLRDGWLYTGDLALMDDKGYFYIVDRKKDMIIVSGFKVFPRELEEVLYQHPRVKEAVVFGIPDSYRGEVVKAVIVPQEGAELTAAEIMDYLTPLVATYKLPKFVEFRDELPKTIVGKVLRRVLREEVEAQMQANSAPAAPPS